ncbi:MAG: DUF1311 domain-containing protein [Rhodobacteraceae bacterium]|nr:DUF1311 domain-containing protein [Paracoccaceae bacterium]
MFRVLIPAAMAALCSAGAFADPLQECLMESLDKTEAERCIYLHYDTCKAASGDDSTAGEVTCLAQEAAVWDGLLNELWPDLRAMAERADAEDTGGGQINANALLASQRAWLAYRDAQCAWEYQRYAAGTLRSIIGASCMLETTARRVLEFRDWLAEGR